MKRSLQGLEHFW